MTQPPDGMAARGGDELRVRLAHVVRQHDLHIDLRREHFDGADAILREIAAAGFVVVDAERLERLRSDAREYCLLWQLGASVAKPRCVGFDFGMGGDLDPVGEAGDR